MNRDVLIVEGDQTLREAVASVIRLHPEFRLTGMAAGLIDGRILFRRTRPDMLVLDMSIPDAGHFLREAAAVAPRPEILALIVSEGGGAGASALREGATGCMLKAEVFECLPEALECHLMGGSFISPRIARELVRGLRSGDDKRGMEQGLPPEASSCLLSDREAQVLEGMARGYKYDELANALGVTTNTVRSHVRSIYRKLDVSSRSEAVFEAAQLGLLRISPADEPPEGG